jgi:LacI family gluconate utilization system Gnt-I transcriptional repressor
MVRSTKTGARRPTIREVSRLAGVSRMTVSRVIRDLDLVLPETRARVHKAIADLGYVPDRAAGSLASRRTGFIALMLPTLTNANFAAAAHGLTEALRSADYHLLIAYDDYSSSEEERQLKNLLARRPEAVVMTGAAHSEATRHMLRAADIPVVEIADLPAEPIEHAVGFSNFEAGRMAARFLLERGFMRIGAIAAATVGDAIDYRGEERMRGFETELSRAGRSPDLVLRHGTPPVSYDHGRALVPRLLELRLDAVFAVSDLSAVGVVMECARRNVAVPRDLAVMGFGNFEIGGEINPPLTTIGVDFRALGQRTGEMLLSLVAQGAGQAPQIVDLGLTIVERASVGTAH